MKLLLTSAGVTKRSLAEELAKLVGKSPSETKVGFIPTAANAEEGNKDWYINQFLNLWRFGYNWIDVVDPSAPDTDWQNRLKDVDVVFVSGGNTFHLLNQLRLTGFDDWLHRNKETKVYVGVSAGTIIASPTIDVANIAPADRNFMNLTDLSGLGWVDFEVEPHCDTRRFTTIEAYAKERSNTIYAIDDQSAVKVDGDVIEVVSEGSWNVYNAHKTA